MEYLYHLYGRGYIKAAKRVPAKAHRRVRTFFYALRYAQKFTK